MGLSTSELSQYLKSGYKASVFYVPSFTLESGIILRNAPIAYKTWGTLNGAGDNAMIICHAFTGSADVEDWWGPLMGRGKVFDPNRYFIFCANVLGSPYGSASPVTLNPDSGKPYGPDFPPTTIRDDIRIQRYVLNHLGVTSVAAVVGGSMGGMATLEWALCSPKGYVRCIVPMATSATHSAWCISWGEAQRQAIYSDPSFQNGYYTSQPTSGLAAARMTAMLTYRSRTSFVNRFGRKQQIPIVPRPGLLTPPPSPNLGEENAVSGTSPNCEIKICPPRSPSPIFSAQSYLRYQGEKFNARFDANCYIHITHKLDTHDVARGRCGEVEDSLAVAWVLSTILCPTLVISIDSDGLFVPCEQRELADHIPHAELVTISSPDGHDGFLLEFNKINHHVLRFLQQVHPQLHADEGSHDTEGFEIRKTSMFGEAELAGSVW